MEKTLKTDFGQSFDKSISWMPLKDFFLKFLYITYNYTLIYLTSIHRNQQLLADELYLSSDRKVLNIKHFSAFISLEFLENPLYLKSTLSKSNIPKYDKIYADNCSKSQVS